MIRIEVEPIILETCPELRIAAIECEVKNSPYSPPALVKDPRI